MIAGAMKMGMRYNSVEMYIFNVRLCCLFFGGVRMWFLLTMVIVRVWNC